MHYHLRTFSLATATLLLSLTSPVLPFASTLSPLVAQAQTTQYRKAEADRLFQEGIEQFRRGQLQEALRTYQQVLAIRRELGDKAGEGETLNNLGEVYTGLSQYDEALEVLQQALAINQDIGNRAGEGSALNGIGEVYFNQGQYEAALALFEQALVIVREAGSRFEEGTVLNNIGLVYSNLGEYAQVLEFLQPALAIRTEIGARAGQGETLNNIALVYYNRGEYARALEYYQQALVIAAEIGNRAVEGTTLSNIGTVYNALGEYARALEYYQQALAIRTEIGARAGKGMTLNNIGTVYNALGEYAQALEYYQQTLAIATETAQGIEIIPAEQQILAEYNKLQNQAIEFGKELAQLRQIPESEWTPGQEQRIAELVTKQGQFKRLFVEFTQRSDVVALINQLSQTAKEQSLQLSRLTNISDNLRNLEQNAVLLYPLVLEDRLELVLTSPDSPPIRRTVPVTREELNRTIVEFRQALQNPNSNAVTPARQFYDWLIKPLENDLAAAEAQTIIYAPDAQLRYIPLAALHDGNNWLAQRFRVNHITADSLTDFDRAPQYKGSDGTSLRVLAGAFTQGSYSFAVGNEQFTFAGLPFAGREVEILAEAVPETTKLIDEEFSKTAILPRMDNHSVVHFATHGALVKGLPEESFILLGNGDRISMREVQNTWFLTNVDLIVLSACETGLGGRFGTGEEILGFGYLMQNAGARASIASLWTVSDGGTQALMNAFYKALHGNDITKAEALRQAQIALIIGDYTALGDRRGSLVVEFIGNNLPKSVQENLSHPYYWAPFILIGNGL